MRAILKWLAVSVAAAGLSVQAGVITQSFTSAEGFVSGALDGQKGWNALSGWTVDPTGSGKVTTTTAGQRMIHNDALTMNVGESFTFRTDFKLLGSPVTPTANTTLLLLGVRPDADETTNPPTFHNTVLSLYANGNVVLRGRNNGAPTITLGSIASNGSANLAVEYTLNVGASAAESTFDMKIINMDSSVFATNSMALDSAIYTALTSGSGVNSYLHSQTFAANSSGVTGMDVFSTTVFESPTYVLTINSGTGSGSYTNGAQVPIAANKIFGKTFTGWTGDTQYLAGAASASSNTVIMSTNPVTLTASYISSGASMVTQSFTSAEGFMDGDLHGQEGWIAQTAWKVDPSGNGKATVTSVWNKAVFDQAYKMIDGDSLTFRTELKLLGTPVTPTATATLMQFGVRTDSSTNNPTSFHNTVLSTFTNGNLVLRGNNNGAPSATLGTIASNGTANLAVEYTINVGASAAASIFGMKIINMDTLSFATSSTNLDSSVYTALTSGNGVYTYLSSAAFDSNSSGVTGIDVFSTTVVEIPVYALTVNGGTGTGSYTNGQQVGISADAPASGYAFDQWTGDTQYVSSVSSSNTTVTMPAQTIAVTATYIATEQYTTNGTPHSWLDQYGLTNHVADDVLDQDSDGLKTWQEYIAGTVPTNAASVLKAVQAVRNVVTWSPVVTGRVYSVHWSTNLVKGFTNLNNNAVSPFTNTSPDSKVNHYQIKVRLP